MPSTETPALTVRDAIASGAARLRAAGCDTPRLDAELLLAHVVGADRAQLVIEPDAAVPEHEYGALIARRAAREPVAYILGRQDFRRLTLEVDPRVLIPRPETELLVEVGLELPEKARVADVGTGSGAVALALKDERPDLEITGIDVDGEALTVARANARRLELDVGFVQADLLDHRPYDAVLANLPYVAQDDQLQPEIELYEPVQALRSGADGLEALRRLTRAAAEVPVIALEVGAGQAGAVAAMLSGRDRVETRRDLGGHERVVIGRRERGRGV